MGVFGTIIGWYNSVKNFIASIPNALNAIWSYITSVWSALGQYVEQLYNYAYTVAEFDLNYAINLYNGIVEWDVNAIQAVYNYIAQQIQAAYQRIVALEYWVYSFIGNLWNQLYAWVMQQLQNFYDTYIAPWLAMLWYAYNWVVNNGAFILNLLTHPILLAEIVGKYLLSAWEGLATEFAVPFFRWFYRNLIGLAPLFSNLIEDILVALFD